MPEILTDAYLLFTFVFKQALKKLWRSKVQFMDKKEYDEAFKSGMFLYE